MKIKNILIILLIGVICFLVYHLKKQNLYLEADLQVVEIKVLEIVYHQDKKNWACDLNDLKAYGYKISPEDYFLFSLSCQNQNGNQQIIIKGEGIKWPVTGKKISSVINP